MHRTARSAARACAVAAVALVGLTGCALRSSDQRAILLPASPALSPGDPTSVRLPAKLCRGAFILPVTFPGPVGEAAGPVTLQLLVDTGATSNLIHPDALERATGRRIGVSRTTKLGGGIADGVRLPVLEARSTALDPSFADMGVDGVLSYRALSGQLLTLDYPSGEIRLSAGSLPPPDGREVFSSEGKRFGGRYIFRLGAGSPALAIPKPWKDGRPWMSVGIGSQSRRMLIDSGAVGAAMFVRSLDGYATAEPPRHVRTGASVEGLMSVRGGRLAEDARLGPHRLEQPILEEGDWRPIDLIGSDVMRNFVWTFDEANRRVRIERKDDEPIRFDSLRTWGVSTRTEDDALRVVKVSPTSAAAGSGLRPGDLITAVNGTPATDQCAEHDGPVVRLTRGRGDAVDEVDLPLTTIVE